MCWSSVAAALVVTASVVVAAVLVECL